MLGHAVSVLIVAAIVGASCVGMLRTIPCDDCGGDPKDRPCHCGAKPR